MHASRLIQSIFSMPSSIPSKYDGDHSFINALLLSTALEGDLSFPVYVFVELGVAAAEDLKFNLFCRRPTPCIGMLSKLEP